MIDETRLWALVERRADATPDALFAVDEDDRVLTFADYRAAGERCAAGLLSRGVTEGTRVSWQLPTWLESLVLVAALARLGAVQNPILPIHRQREVEFATRQSRARLMVVPRAWRGFDHEAMARSIAGGREELQVLLCDRELPEGDPAMLPDASLRATAERSRPGWIFYSSGTTAEPKGALHSDASLAAAARAMAGALALQPDDRVAMVFPVTHVGGIGWLFAGLMAGCAQLVVASFDPRSSIEVLRRHGVTQATAGTVFHQAYLAAQRELGDVPLFPGVRAFPGGGAPKPSRLHFEIKRELGGAGIVSGYGMTECPIATMNRIGDPDDKLALTEGRPTPGVELRIVRADGSRAETDEEGEIRVRGPQLCLGYVDPELDRQAFDAEGFLCSGDLGHLDADGFLVVTGRLKDVIIRKGENISAAEVEDHLFAHPAISDVAVIGVPDEEAGERCCAVLVVEPGATAPDLEETRGFLLERGLAIQKVPEQLEIVEALPRNPSGKILKRALRDRYGKATDG